MGYIHHDKYFCLVIAHTAKNNHFKNTIHEYISIKIVQEEEGQQFFYDMKAGPPTKGRKRGHQGERGGGGGGGRGRQEGENRHRDYQEKKPRKDGGLF